MKSFIIIALFLGMNITSFSQNKTEDDSNDWAMKSIDLPEVVIKSAGKDFSIYLTDKNPDPTVRHLENEFISYNLGKDFEGYDNYLVILEIPKGKLSATYDSNGKLTSVIEKYNNTQLPTPVIYSIYKSYPGWQIVNDKYLYTQENGDVITKEYNLTLKKNNETIKLKVNPKGEIIGKN